MSTLLWIIFTPVRAALAVGLELLLGLILSGELLLIALFGSLPWLPYSRPRSEWPRWMGGRA